jgi:hypothetical protein
MTIGRAWPQHEESLMKHLKKSVLAAGIAAILPGLTLAAATGPTLGDVFKNSGVTVNGYVDASYTYLTGSGTFTGSTANRVYDRERNSFNLHAVDLSIGYLPTSGFGAFTQFDLGSDANVSASTGTGSSDEYDVQQAYVQYAAGPLTVIGGKFATLAGAEVITSPSNLNFTRSILFGYAIPFTHTGARASYAINDAYKVILGVNNGWDVLKTSAGGTSDSKTIEVGVAMTPIKPLSINLAGYYGDAAVTTTYGAPRYVIDLVATYNISDDLSVAINADIGEQKDVSAAGTDAKWSGVAAYVNWKFAKQFRVAVRAESFNDKDGYRTGVTGGQTWNEATATLAYLASDNAEIRLEGRYDKSDVKAFNMPDGTTKDNQSSVGIEAIFKF